MENSFTLANCLDDDLSLICGKACHLLMDAVGGIISNGWLIMGLVVVMGFMIIAPKYDGKD